MRNKDNTIICPALGRNVTSAECVVICDVAARLLKPRVLDELEPPIQWNDERANKCRLCEWHEK